MVRRTRFGSTFTLGFLALAAIAALSYSLWLPWFGTALIRDDGPAKADIAVVLAGDEWGHRILKGAELVRQGYVPAVLVSGPPYYGVHECDAAIAFAVRQGYPAESLIPFPHTGLSTKEEAGFVIPELRRRNIHSFILVTSDYHTARSARVFRAVARSLGGSPEFRVVAAPDEFFKAGSWWQNRQGQKTVFFEWSKVVANAVGM